MIFYSLLLVSFLNLNLAGVVVGSVVGSVVFVAIVAGVATVVVVVIVYFSTRKVRNEKEVCKFNVYT